MTYLDLSAIGLRYGDNVILDGIDLSVEQGEMHVLLGPSGCGKTTLLRSIAGLVQPDRGAIHLAGRAIEMLHPKDRGIGMVFQHYALFPNMTVRQNLAFGLEQRRLVRKVIDEKIDAVLEIVSLQNKADARPRQLSGGQKQRVALARALVLEPSLLLLDEPLSALDAQIRKRLRDELKRIQRRTGLTSILVTHDQDEALSLGDRISVMNNGRITQTASGPEIFYRPADLFVAKFIGNANILTAAEFSRLIGRDFDQTAIIHPHVFKIGKASEGSNLFEVAATVVETVAAGNVVRYVMQANGIMFNVEAQSAMNEECLAAGTGTTLSINPSNGHFLKEN
ncbi:putative spermidine/putrescine transport system ATP-binding protein [Neorhizobium huautlense]|uniref:Spermidine/putrescine transport system ATP-binding protein n=1 Tax=Neorhizobium huautlense TaxID=67774 RepID=A0ABT9PS46_9HYPH|nr:ABC transporter ATP-binding protein [Neorhizobium huautlense]MDP9836973.1 putative spermidine/putrescine transport system ATP-binding protein [Neorhizobium huautlense]